MKNKFHNFKSMLVYFINSEKFKITYFLTILLSVYGAFALGQNINSNQEAIIIMFQFPFFNIFLQFIVLINTITICSTFSKEFIFYNIRKEKKKEVTKDLIILTILYNLLYFVLLFIILTSFCLLLKGTTINNRLYYGYSVSYNIYMWFYVIRYTIITILFSIINTILYQKIREKIIIFNIFFIIALIVYPTSFEAKSIFNIIPWNYFIFSNYSTFSNEIISSLLFIGLILIAILFSFKYIYKVNKR